MAAGFDHARGDVIVPMDGDLQNDPADIRALLDKIDEGYDVVSGWRRDRKDSFVRRLPSRIANWLIGRVTGVRLHDYGCTLKAYRAEIVRETRLYGEMHRFLPALAYQAGARITEIPVTPPSAVAGKSSYGLGRTFKVLLDLMTVKFLSVWSTKPSYVFGGSGRVLCLLGTAFVTWTAYEKFVNGVYVYRQPSLIVGVFLFTIGLNLILLGLLAELIVRTHHESQAQAHVPRARAPNFEEPVAAPVAAVPHVRDLRDVGPAPVDRAVLARMTRVLRAPRAGRRGLPRRRRRRRHRGRARLPPAVDHRPRHRATSRSRTRTASVQVVFNGEIYNYRELRAELVAPRPPVRDDADTEVIVHLYEDLGAALRRAAQRDVRVRALGRRSERGCCSHATASGRSRSTTPKSATALLFGSELKSLLEHPRCPRELDFDERSPRTSRSSTSRRRARSSRASEAPRRPRPRLARRAVVGSSVLGSLVRARRRRRARRGATRRSFARVCAPPSAATARQRRPARRVPERRDRLELGRRDDVRGAAGRSRQDLLDRLRRARASTSRRTRGGSRSTSAPTTTRTCSRRARMLDLLPTVAGLPRRAVRRRVGPADVPALALHARVGHGRARRRRQRRAPRRLSDLPRRPRRRVLPGASRAARARRDPARGPPARLDRRTSASTSSSSGSCAARRRRRRSGTPSGSARSRRPSRARLLTRPAVDPFEEHRRRFASAPTRRPRRAADLPLREDVPPGRHPREGRPREHGLLARGARAVPRRRARRVPRPRSAAAQAARFGTKHLLKRAMARPAPDGHRRRGRRRASAFRSPSGSRASCANRSRTSSRRSGSRQGIFEPRRGRAPRLRAPERATRPPQAALDAVRVPALAPTLDRARPRRGARGGRRARQRPMSGALRRATSSCPESRLLRASRSRADGDDEVARRRARLRRLRPPLADPRRDSAPRAAGSRASSSGRQPRHSAGSGSTSRACTRSSRRSSSTGSHPTRARVLPRQARARRRLRNRPPRVLRGDLRSASEVVALDLSDAVETARETSRRSTTPTSCKAISSARRSARPTEGGGFDLIYSIGVLHHLPDPYAGFPARSSYLRPGGTIAVWVYGYENNGFVRNVVEPMRRVSTRVPPPCCARSPGRSPSASTASRRASTDRSHGTAVGQTLPLDDYLTSVADFSFRQNYGDRLRPARRSDRRVHPRARARELVPRERTRGRQDHPPARELLARQGRPLLPAKRQAGVESSRRDESRRSPASPSARHVCASRRRWPVRRSRVR